MGMKEPRYLVPLVGQLIRLAEEGGKDGELLANQLKQIGERIAYIAPEQIDRKHWGDVQTVINARIPYKKDMSELPEWQRRVVSLWLDLPQQVN